MAHCRPSLNGRAHDHDTGGYRAVGLQGWFGGDFAPVTEVERVADQAGIDLVSITDHVVIGETRRYPYGPFPAPLDFP